MDRQYDNNLLNYGTANPTSDIDVEMALLSVCLRQERAVNETVGKHLVKEDFDERKSVLELRASAPANSARRLVSKIIRTSRLSPSRICSPIVARN